MKKKQLLKAGISVLLASDDYICAGNQPGG